VDAHHAGLAEHAVDDAVFRSHGGGVGVGRLAPRLRGSSLEHDDGFPARHLPGDLQKTARILEALDIDDDRRSLRVLSEILQRLALLHVDLVPEADHAAGPEMLAREDVFHRMGREVSRLRDERNPARPDLPEREEGRGEFEGRGRMA